MKVLLTGGAGYIGSVTATALEDRGHEPVVLDSLVTGTAAFVRGRTFYRGDIADRAMIRRIVEEHPDIEGVIHMAALAVVPESMADPYRYYENNVSRSLILFDELQALGLTRVIFSSSASVYAPSENFEVAETHPLAPASPYAETKAMIERILADLTAAGSLRAISLRYFNPLGADPELRSGAHVRQPSHVLGQLVAAARGEIPAFAITGVDYPTRDGTGVRDYVHVWDLAEAHVRALERFDHVVEAAGAAHAVVNLGTGAGTTVRELVHMVEEVIGRAVPVVEAPPRPGDVAGAFATVTRAQEWLDWRAQLTVVDAVRSALDWAEIRDRVLAGPTGPDGPDPEDPGPSIEREVE